MSYLAATGITSATAVIICPVISYSQRIAIAAIRVRNHVSRNRAIRAKSANKFRSLSVLVSRNKGVLLALACLEFKALVFRPKFLQFAIRQKIKDCTGVAVVVFQNISCSILNGVSGIASLCCQIVVRVSEALFNCSLSLAAAILLLESWLLGQFKNK